jgi:hypothetical protein
LALSTAYHLQTDRQSERVNQCVEIDLRCAVHATPTKWKQWCALAEFWYNSSHHYAIGCSPFKALYGYEAPFEAAPAISDDTDPSVSDWLRVRAAHSTLLKKHLANA